MSGPTRCACVARREGLDKPGTIFEVCDSCTPFGYPSYVAKIKEQRVLFKKLHPDAIIPKKQREGDAAFDLYLFEDGLESLSLGYDTLGTGIACAIPDGYVGIIKGRSGLASKHCVHVLGGVIDSNYRGEIKVVLDCSRTVVTFKPGDRIAQLLVVPIHNLGSAEVDELPENTVRGEQGFGSSGV